MIVVVDLNALVQYSLTYLTILLVMFFNVWIFLNKS